MSIAIPNVIARTSPFCMCAHLLIVIATKLHYKTGTCKFLAVFIKKGWWRDPPLSASRPKTTLGLQFPNSSKSTKNHLQPIA